jgi:hypothetical protein
MILSGFSVENPRLRLMAKSELLIIKPYNAAQVKEIKPYSGCGCVRYPPILFSDPKFMFANAIPEASSTVLSRSRKRQAQFFLNNFNFERYSPSVYHLKRQVINPWEVSYGETLT